VALSRIKFGESGRVVLLDKSGTILYAENKSLLMTPAPAEIQALIKPGQDTWVHL